MLSFRRTGRSDVAYMPAYSCSFATSTRGITRTNFGPARTEVTARKRTSGDYREMKLGATFALGPLP
jgi:hypothetical protein